MTEILDPTIAMKIPGEPCPDHMYKVAGKFVDFLSGSLATYDPFKACRFREGCECDNRCEEYAPR